MSIQTSAGSKISIATGVPATYDNAGFTAVGLVYKAVGEVSDLGSFGKKFNSVDFIDLGSRKKRTLKGSYENGTIALQMARDADDDGQDLMRTARDSDSEFSFKIELQDGSKFFFTGLVMGFDNAVGSADAVVMSNADITIVSDIVEVAAS